jgi:hypothetical protein
LGGIQKSISMSYSIDKSTELVIVTYWGSLTVDDVQAVVDDALNSKDKEYKNRIEDIREVSSINLGFKELMNFAQNLKIVKMLHLVKTAILTNSALQYGVARMFQIIIDYPLMKIEIFTNEEKARKWLLSDD